MMIMGYSVKPYDIMWNPLYNVYYANKGHIQHSLHFVFSQ